MHVLIACPCHDASSRSLHQKTHLQQKWLIYVRDCIRLFTDSCCNSIKSDRAASEFLNHSIQHTTVSTVKPCFVNLKTA